MDPWTREPVFIEKDPQRKQKQKDVVTQKEHITHRHDEKQTFTKHNKHKKRKNTVQKEQFKENKPSNYKEYKTLHKERKNYTDASI